MELISTLLIAIPIIVVSMVLHEMAHGYVAYWLGDQTPKAQGRLSPNPFKHLDPFLSFLLPLSMALMGGPIFGGAKPVQINTAKIKYREWGMALVALAGPLTNIILAYLLFVIFHYSEASLSPLVAAILSSAIFINLGFAVFNLIPIPPLDGSRLLYALAPEPIQNFMQKIERTGPLVVFAIIFIAGGLVSAFIGSAILFIRNGVFHCLVI